MVMVLLCLILFGILQVSLVTAAHDVLIYAASAGLRCATIGYDDTMVAKAVHVAALPNMGPKNVGWAEELSRIRDYLAYEDSAENPGVLDYIRDDYWVSLQEPEVDSSADLLTISLLQDYPLSFPFARAFYNKSTAELSTSGLDLDREMAMEYHANLYLGY